LKKIDEMAKADGAQATGQAHGNRQYGHDGMLIGSQFTQCEALLARDWLIHLNIPGLAVLRPIFTEKCANGRYRPLLSENICNFYTAALT
jgi:hypothetical protein